MSGAAAPVALPAASEAVFARRWAAGLPAPARTEDGRPLRVVFPGVAGGGPGPDFRGAILELDGDLLRGDVEIHIRASGWQAHGHHRDPAYAGVVLHVVERNDSGAASTRHTSGRAIAVLVLPAAAGQAEFPPPFTPPCALRSAQDGDAACTLARLGHRRLRMKAERLRPLVSAIGPGPALYATLLGYSAAPANRAQFALLAARLPLPALLDRAEGAESHARAVAAELRGAAAGLNFSRRATRPAASADHRLTAAAALVTRLWPAGSAPAWPTALITAEQLLPVLQVEGIGRALAIELACNAVLPVALAAATWSETEVEASLASLPSPGTYGRLKPLERWLGHAGRPFRSAGALQGGLLLHSDYCERGMCGRCPFS